jgi:hypothetical protein
MAGYAIATPKLFGVSITTMRPLVKTLKRDQATRADLSRRCEPRGRTF